MNFSIDRAPLLEALQQVQSVVEKKNTIQILGNVLCSVRGQELTLCATDLEVGIKVTLPVETHEEGRITLAAKHFLDIVKELPNKKLKIVRKDNNWVELLCGKSRFNIVSLPAEQYPTLPEFPDFQGDNTHKANTNALIEMIDRTQFAASEDATRYHINGVFLVALESNMLRMVAMDGHRLSFVDQEVFLKNPDLKRGVIIPKKALTEFRKILARGSAVDLSFERGHLFSQCDGISFFGRLIDGEYPDYRPMIPQTSEQSVQLDRQEFNSALKRMSLLANEKSRGVKLSLNQNTLVISSSNPDMGEAREEMDVVYTGGPIEIGFNSQYLLECLGVVKAEKLEFNLKDRLSAGILREHGLNTHTYVIMPMRV